MSKIDEIKARLAKATPGPWAWLPWHIVEGNPQVRAKDKNGSEYLMCEVASDADAALIAHAPSDLAYLLPLAERAEKAEQALAEATRWHPIDTAPVGEVILLSDGNKRWMGCRERTRAERMIDDWLGSNCTPLYWTPLPTPPEPAIRGQINE